MSKKIHVALADDQKLFRQGVISLLKAKDKSVNVVAEVGNGKELLIALKKGNVHLAIFDLETPQINGEELLEIISKRFPKVKVIILSTYYDGTLVAQFMGLGALAFLSKNSDVKNLISAIHSAYKGISYIDEGASRALLAQAQYHRLKNTFLDKHSLRPREIQVLKLACLGKKNKEIAQKLNLTISTIDFHKRNIYKKTRTENIAQLVLFAIRSNLISVNS